MMSTREADKFLLHPFTAIQDHETNGPHIITRAEGIHVFDADGNGYIDAMAGLWCANVGYGRREIGEAVADQINRLSYYHSFMSLANEPSTLLAERLAKAAPGELNHVFFCNSGSEANDTHVKLVWYYNNLRGRPEKKKFIGRHGGYHGVTLASASLSGLPNLRKGFDVMEDRFLHVTRPHAFWEKPGELSELEWSTQLAQEVEDLIIAEGPDTVAAFIAEPVMGAGGVIPPPEGYFDAVIPVLKKYDVLFIADEVVCGFGRLGRMFGSEHFNLQPDLMTLAKGLTSGYVPMSACMISDAIYEVLRSGTPEMGPFAHGYTYSAHPVAAAAGLANLDIIERENLVENAARTGTYLQSELRRAVSDHPLVGDVRGLGMIAGVELLKDKTSKTPFELSEGVSKKLYRHGLKRGLIVRPILNMLAFSPPLILATSDVDEVVGKFSAALTDLHEELARDSV